MLDHLRKDDIITSCTLQGISLHLKDKRQARGSLSNLDNTRQEWKRTKESKIHNRDILDNRSFVRNQIRFQIIDIEQARQAVPSTHWQIFNTIQYHCSAKNTEPTIHVNGRGVSTFNQRVRAAEPTTTRNFKEIKVKKGKQGHTKFTHRSKGTIYRKHIRTRGQTTLWSRSWQQSDIQDNSHYSRRNWWLLGLCITVVDAVSASLS